MLAKREGEIQMPTFNNVPGTKTTTSVPVIEVDKLSDTTFSGKYVSNSRPLVIKGGVKHWSAIEKWHDMNYLKKCAGHHEIFLYPSEFRNSRKLMEAKGKRLMLLADATDYLHAAETEIGIVVTGRPTELLSDLGGVPYLSNMQPGFAYPPVRHFFFRNTGANWHFHSFDETLMCQIVGSKKIGLLNVNNPSGWIVRNIFLYEHYYDDPSAFDGFDNTGLQWFEASLDPGDALYIPPLWWHGVVTTTTSFGLTTALTWRSPPHIIADSLKRMASGDADIVGKLDYLLPNDLRDVARKMGLEEEFASA
jgi:hypothetical protein